MACDPLHPLDCIGDGIGAVAGSAIDAFVKSIADGVVSVLKTLSTVWMSIPSPDVQGSGAVATITADLSWYTAVFALVGVLIALGRTGLEMRAQPAVQAARMLVTLVIVTGCGATVVGTLVAAGDAFAPWIIDRAAGQDFTSGSATIITAELLTGAGQGIGLLVGAIALLGSIAQIVFMLVRAAMILILMGMLPSFAAASGTEGGAATFRKAMAWLLAFVLYKPLAAIVYATGFLLIKGDSATTGAGDTGTIMTLLIGLTVIILAALTLPALIRGLVPLAAAGTSSAFSGGAMVGALATGAAVVALGGATGAGAGKAGGAAGAATGGGGGGGGSAAGAAGAGATPPPGGGSAGGGGAAVPGGSGGGAGPTPTGGTAGPAGASGGSSTDGAGSAGDSGGSGGPAGGVASRPDPSSSSGGGAAPAGPGGSPPATPAGGAGAAGSPASGAGPAGARPAGGGAVAGGATGWAQGARAAGGAAGRSDRAVDDSTDDSGASGASTNK